MSRAARVGRGAAGAFIATALAAVSHSIGGGQITLLAVFATAILAMPLCVALAGKLGSLWRLGLGVGVSQFIYHWSFAGLGVSISSPLATSGESMALPVSPHAEHLAQMQNFVPAIAEAGAASWVMWLSHLVAAVATVALLYRGERATVALGRLLTRTIFTPVFLSLRSETGSIVQPVRQSRAPLAERLRSLSAISHRGPPILR